MALNKKDLQAIGKVVDERIDRRLQKTESNIDKRFQQTEDKFDKRIQQTESRLDGRIQQTEDKLMKEIGSTRLESNQRFENLQEKMAQNYQGLVLKIDAVQVQLSEDIVAVAQDVDNLKHRVVKLEGQSS